MRGGEEEGKGYTECFAFHINGMGRVGENRQITISFTILFTRLKS